MNVKRIYAVACLIAAIGIAGFYIDSRMKSGNTFYLTQTLPAVSSNNNSGSTTSIVLRDYGKAPEFTGINAWLNSNPLTIVSLKGKVVLVDFWTFSCINCIRTLPYVAKWYDTYKDVGLVVVGVHTPEFAFEKETNNVQDAIKRFGIHYPVAQDNEYATWNAYSNQYWPAEYLINQQGEIVYTHFGEGEYDNTENAIRELLGMNASVSPNNGQNLTGVGSPEMYFGLNRIQNFSPGQLPSEEPKSYIFPPQLALNSFALFGKWQFHLESVSLGKGGGKIRLRFHSGKVYMVAESPMPTRVKIVVDGIVQKSVTIGVSRLYTLFDSKDYSDHLLEITVDEPGFQAFTFTFG